MTTSQMAYQSEGVGSAALMTIPNSVWNYGLDTGVTVWKDLALSLEEAGWG